MSEKEIKRIQNVIELPPLKEKSWKISGSQKLQDYFTLMSRFLPPIEKDIGKEFCWFGVWVLSSNFDREEIIENWEVDSKEYEVVKGGIKTNPKRDLINWLQGTDREGLLRSLYQRIRINYRYTKNQIKTYTAIKNIDQAFFSLKKIPSKLQINIMGLLAKKPTYSIKEIVRETGVSEKTIRRNIIDMRNKFFFRIAGFLVPEKIGLARYRLITSNLDIDLKTEFLTGKFIMWSSKPVQVFDLMLPNDIDTIKFCNNFIKDQKSEYTNYFEQIDMQKWLKSNITISDKFLDVKNKRWNINKKELTNLYKLSTEDKNFFNNNINNDYSLSNIDMDRFDLEIIYQLLIDYKVTSKNLTEKINIPIKEVIKRRKRIIESNIILPIPWRWYLDLPETVEIHISSYQKDVRIINFLKNFPFVNFVNITNIVLDKSKLISVLRLPRGGALILKNFLEQIPKRQDLQFFSRQRLPYMYSPFPSYELFNKNKQKWEWTNRPFSIKKGGEDRN